jgi:hypothetical protein
MYVMYYVSMFRCWQLIRILVKTNHPCLRVGRHRSRASLLDEFRSHARVPRWFSMVPFHFQAWGVTPPLPFWLQKPVIKLPHVVLMFFPGTNHFERRRIDAPMEVKLIAE